MSDTLIAPMKKMTMKEFRELYPDIDMNELDIAKKSLVEQIEKDICEEFANISSKNRKMKKIGDLKDLEKIRERNAQKNTIY